MIEVLRSVCAVVFTLGVVILLHEFGHFIVCRWVGVRVEKFAFGFGPELFGVTRNGTRYSLCAFPLGGYVKPAGDDPGEASGKPDEYFSQKWNRRLAIVAAGPTMNYILAFALFTGLIYFKGIPEPGEKAVIGNMIINHPADRAGIEIGDEITAIDGVRVADWESLASIIHKKPGIQVAITFRRGSETLTRKITPVKDKDSGRGMIGIMSQPVYREVGLLTSVKEGAWQCWRLTAFTVKTIASKIYKREKPDLAGPVGIIQMVSRAARSGLEDLIFLMGLISVAIGFFNILPIPLLDGGHAVFYLWEGISGRKATQKTMAAANGFGIVFIVCLLVFATYNDVSRIVRQRSAAGESASSVKNGSQ